MAGTTPKHRGEKTRAARPSWGAVALAAVLAMALTVPVASADPNKSYTAAINPMAVSGGDITTYTYTLTSSTGNNQTFGSANIAIPAGFTSVTTSSVSAAGWTHGVVGSTIQLRNPAGPAAAISPGGSVTVTFSAQAPCAPGVYAWPPSVKQSNDFNGTGNDFTLSGSVPTVTVSAGCSLDFEVEPGDAFAGFPIPAHLSNPPAPPFVVRAINGNGDLVPSFTGTVSLTLNDLNSVGAALSGTTTKAAVGGKASFNDVVVDKAGSFTLTASATNAASDTSRQFEVTGKAANCQGQTTCSASTGSDVSDTDKVATTVTITCPTGGCTGFLSVADLEPGSNVGAFCNGICRLGSFFNPAVGAQGILTYEVIVSKTELSGPPSGVVLYSDLNPNVPLPGCPKGKFDPQSIPKTGCIDKASKTPKGDYKFVVLHLEPGDPRNAFP